MKVKVSVEQRHIDKGRRGDCKRCPIAQALFELGLAPAVMVKDGYDIKLGYYEKVPRKVYNKQTYTVVDGHETHFVPFATAGHCKAWAFIRDFDTRGKEAVKPFSMVLNFNPL